MATKAHNGLARFQGSCGVWPDGNPIMDTRSGRMKAQGGGASLWARVFPGSEGAGSGGGWYVKGCVYLCLDRNCQSFLIC